MILDNITNNKIIKNKHKWKSLKIQKKQKHHQKKNNCIRYLNFTNIKHFGIPKNTSPVMAYHFIQGIIALGTTDGKIKL